MANFRTFVSKSPRNGNWTVRYRDGKTKLPNGAWKKFTHITVSKTTRVFKDGEWKTAKWIADDHADKLVQRFHEGKLQIVNSSDSLDELIDAYLDDKNGLAWKTITHYRNCLTQLNKEFKLPTELTRDSIIEWRERLKKEGYSNNTIHGIMNDSRMFCNWLVYKKKITHSPFKKDNPQDKGIVPAQTKARPRFYTIDEFSRLEKVVASLDPLVRIGCRLAHDCGLRKVEMVGDGVERLSGVLWEDLIWRPDGKVDLLVRAEVTKGQKKERKIRVPNSLVALLGSRKTGPICPITPWHFDWVVKQALKLAKIKKMPGLFIHAFRHSFGKNFLQLSGSNRAALQDLLGHEDEETTEIYSQFEQSYLDEQVDKAAEKVETEKARISAGQNSIGIRETV